ncbi:MAG TPA: hypothetical protein VLM79_36695 [Kofleriaceae bacterium]|nr:hypothetical protein [Kofleriaceae bacterium]
MSTKVHVTVREHLVGDDSVVARVVSVGQLGDVNLSRAAMFGVITGIVQDQRFIAALQEMPEVESVDIDQRRHILGDVETATRAQTRS